MKKINKKAMFFQLLMIIGFQILLFTAVINGLAKSSKSPVVNSNVKALFNDQAKILYKNHFLDWILFADKYSLDYLNCINHECDYYDGLWLISQTADYKKGLIKYLKARCGKDLKCNFYFKNNTLVMNLNKGQETRRDTIFYLSFSKNYTLNSGLLFNKIKKDVGEGLNSCENKSCLSNLLKSKGYDVIDDNKKSVLGEIIDDLRNCFDNVDYNCYCFDSSMVPRGYQIKFKRVVDGVDVKIYKNLVLIRNLTFYSDYSSFNYDINTKMFREKSVSIENFQISSEGIISELSDNLKFKYIKVEKDDSKNYKLKLLKDKGNLEKCGNKIDVVPIGNFFAFELRKNLSGLSKTARFKVEIDVSKSRDQNKILYNSDGSEASKRIIKALKDNYVSFLKKYNFQVFEDKSLSLEKGNIKFKISVKDFENFKNNILDGRELRESLDNLFVFVLKKSTPVEIYSSDEVLKLSYKGFNFSTFVLDTKPPKAVSNLELIPVEYSGSDFILKFDLDDLSTEGFSIYAGNHLITTVLRKSFVKLDVFNYENIALNGYSFVYDDIENSVVRSLDQGFYTSNGNVYTYYLYLPNLESVKDISVESFDKRGNINRSSYLTNINYPNEVPRSPECDLSTFSFDFNKKFDCSVEKSIFGKKLVTDYKDLKYLWVCSDTYLDVISSKEKNRPTELCDSGPMFLFVYYGDLLDFIKNAKVIGNPDLEKKIKMYDIKVYKIIKVVEGTTESFKIEPVKA